MMETKNCSRCKKALPLSNFYIKYKNPIIKYYPECKSCRAIIAKNYTDKNKDHCKEVSSKYYLENRDRIRTRDAKYNLDNKEHVTILKQVWTMAHIDSVRETKRKHNLKLRESFLDMYGRICACCGEDKVEFLTIEHKLGQRGIVRHKKETGKFAYSRAIKEYRPDLYETLCMNCNFSKGRYGYCPHQKS